MVLVSELKVFYKNSSVFFAFSDDRDLVRLYHSFGSFHDEQPVNNQENAFVQR